MLFDRQKRLLAFLDALGGESSATDFQKLLFLCCQESSGTAWYEFVPYRFGGFSYTSYADKRKLIEQGLLEDENEAWRLTPAGRTAVRKSGYASSYAWFARKTQGLRGDALVAQAYRKYPYYAIRSEIAGRVLQGDSAALLGIEQAKPSRGASGIVTIGYEGRSLEAYLNLLIRNGVTLLCDVRRNPLSRKYGFSKGTLSQGCTGVGIRYEHLPDLGIASDERRELVTQADYDQLFARYERDTLPGQSAALSLIKGWVDKDERVALTCFEHLPEQCHRHCVAKALTRTYGRELIPLHL
jgi:Protein of unknown function, DUF488